MQFGNRHHAATARFLATGEGAEIMARYARRHPRTARCPCAFMGLPADGSEASFREAGHAIPFVRLDAATASRRPRPGLPRGHAIPHPSAGTRLRHPDSPPHRQRDSRKRVGGGTGDLILHYAMIAPGAKPTAEHRSAPRSDTDRVVRNGTAHRPSAGPAPSTVPDRPTRTATVGRRQGQARQRRAGRRTSLRAPGATCLAKGG